MRRSAGFRLVSLLPGYACKFFIFTYSYGIVALIYKGFVGNAKGQEYMNGSFSGTKHTGTKIRIVFLLVLLCLAVLGASPVMAKKKDTAGKVKRIRIYGKAPKLRDAEKRRWMMGSFKDGIYYDRDGEVVTSFAEEDKKPLPKIAGLYKKPYLFIGASRTDQFKKFVKDRKTSFYGCVGAQFDWFFRCGDGGNYFPAYHVIRAYAKYHPGGTVIVDMGGNDIKNLSTYASFYKELMEKFPEITFYFLMPFPYEIGAQDNALRMDFCQKMEEEVPGHVINVFEEIYTRVLLRFPTFDGKHYTKLPIRISYEIVINKMGRSISVNRKTGKVTETVQ